MKELTCFLVLIIMVFIYMNYVRKQLYLSLVKSPVNNREYYVRNLKDKQEAADTLARLTQELLSLLDSIKGKDKKGIDQLRDRFDPNNITENIPGSLYVAYSVNKGDELSICIRDKKTDKFIDMNTILFVAIHELAHIMSTSNGHTKEFWDNMNYLLKEAIQIGIYQRVNYKEQPIDYCGMEINNTPLNME
jgi:hypothetical protein